MKKDNFRKYISKQIIENIREKEKDNQYDLWIARDDFEYDEDGNVYTGKLHIFYDEPSLEYDERIHGYRWSDMISRKILDVPAYMYPNIREKQCVKYIASSKLTNHE